VNLHLRESGLVVATDKPPEPPPALVPPEHPVRAVIRDALRTLADGLSHFEQTTHGSLMARMATAELVSEALVRAYDKPDAYSISELSQRIRAFVGQQSIDDKLRRAEQLSRELEQLDREICDTIGCKSGESANLLPVPSVSL
jgi:hypothetical protein